VFLDVVMVALPLALFVALGAAFVLVYRRATDLAADSRASDALRRSAAEQAARAIGALGDVITPCDAARQGSGDPLAAATAAGSAAAGALPTLIAARDAVVDLRPRAGQAAALADLGTAIGAAADAIAATTAACGARAAAPSAAETLTAVKRSFLGLVHARDAIADAARRVEETAMAGAARPSSGARGGGLRKRG
jgi:hypothetical protein